MPEAAESSGPAAGGADHQAKKREDEGPPDGGWGWVVVFASFCSFATTFIVRSPFIMLYMEWVDYFHGNKGGTGWIGSLFQSSGYILSEFETNRSVASSCYPHVVFIGIKHDNF